MSFNELKDCLSMGREIEFFFKDVRYSICNTPNGWILSEFYGDYQTYPSSSELLQNATIDGFNLKQIWDQVDIDIIF
ncbi:hypothetical protein BP422_11870 [Brevibacillus formosus]|uniref:Uncharacterized protein n=1 Tax=Brevibacillus formosus TaxID=54913 RepID=A0A220MGK4_9BACL|nr:hypothetical protein [Brevibacillus formosus]ASJ54181.1 hypothetical protein BP422_11870 [Brevibacillus formosus]